uniref:Uncharacterized protein n=1 Tax=Knipowitschia caucasica TaxID=637954 RepID=A0AAV2M5N4_KNICA
MCVRLCTCGRVIEAFKSVTDMRLFVSTLMNPELRPEPTAAASIESVHEKGLEHQWALEEVAYANERQMSTDRDLEAQGIKGSVETWSTIFSPP